MYGRNIHIIMTLFKLFEIMLYLNKNRLVNKHNTEKKKIGKAIAAYGLIRMSSFGMFGYFTVVTCDHLRWNRTYSHDSHKQRTHSLMSVFRHFPLACFTCRRTRHYDHPSTRMFFWFMRAPLSYQDHEIPRSESVVEASH